MSDLERSWEETFTRQQETIARLERENRLLHEIGNAAVKALVDAIHVTAATGPLAAVTGVMDWLVEHEMDVPWHELDDDWLKKWESDHITEAVMEMVASDREEAEGRALAAEAEIERLQADLDRVQLALIEAQNPGIDMEAVRRARTR